MRRCLKSSYKQNVSCILDLACITDTAHSIATPNTVTFRVCRQDRPEPGSYLVSAYHPTPDRSQDVGSRKEIAAKPPLSCLCSYGVLRTSCLVICERQRDSDHITFQLRHATKCAGTPSEKVGPASACRFLFLLPLRIWPALSPSSPGRSPHKCW